MEGVIFIKSFPSRDGRDGFYKTLPLKGQVRRGWKGWKG
jgi:hypothetical protein